MKTLKQIFDEGREAALTGKAQSIRQAPYHHKEQRIIWQAGLMLALEELQSDEKLSEEKPKPKPKSKKKSSDK